MWIHRYNCPLGSPDYPSAEKLITGLVPADKVLREIRGKLERRKTLDVKWFLETGFFLLREGDADHGKAVITNPLGAVLVLEEYDLLDETQLGKLASGIESGRYHPPGERYFNDAFCEKCALGQAMLDIGFDKIEDFSGSAPYPYGQSYYNGGWIFLSDYLLSGREMPDRWVRFLYRLFEDMYKVNIGTIKGKRVVVEKLWEMGSLGLIYPIAGDRETEEAFYKKRTIKALTKLVKMSPPSSPDDHAGDASRPADGNEVVMDMYPIIECIEWKTLEKDVVALYPSLMCLGQKLDFEMLFGNHHINEIISSSRRTNRHDVDFEPFFSRKNWQKTVKFLDPEHTLEGDRQRFAVKLIRTGREEFVREVVERGAVRPEDIRRAYKKLPHEGEEIKMLPYLIYVAQVKGRA